MQQFEKNYDAIFHCFPWFFQRSGSRSNTQLWPKKCRDYSTRSGKRSHLDAGRAEPKPPQTPDTERDVHGRHRAGARRQGPERIPGLERQAHVPSVRLSHVQPVLSLLRRPAQLAAAAGYDCSGGNQGHATGLTSQTRYMTSQDMTSINQSPLNKCTFVCVHT